MASDFNSCGFGGITPELIFRSVLRGYSPIGGLEPFCGLGIVETTCSRGHITPHVCTSENDLYLLIQRSLVMADDGKVAIRSCTSTNNNGLGLASCQSCASGEPWYQMAARLFSLDDNGDVCLLIANIT